MWSGGLRTADPTSCTLCPLYPVNGVMTPVYVRFGRGRFDSSTIATSGRSHAAYFNDSWNLNKFVTLGLGMRWEQWHMAGTGSAYTFTDNWAPRVSASVDPFGDRKTKFYSSFARYNFQTPLDAAIRSLSGEKDLINMSFAPASTGGIADINPNGTINVIPDAAHLLNQAVGGIAITPSIGASNYGEGFAPGTKLMYQNEWIVGAEHEFKHQVVVSGRFLYRNMPRILEDVAGVSPEAYNFGYGQNYFIANPSPTLDLFPNANEVLYPSGTPPAGCTVGANASDSIYDTNGLQWLPGQGICFLAPGGNVGPSGQPIPDGIPDGFPQAIHIYKAVEIEVNKGFAENWMLRANWRIASLTGNYEGAYRNDNGQTDPNISSLFDFTNGIVGMLGDQYKPGPLNTDRRHIVNTFVTYAFPHGFLKNLTLGPSVTFSSGTPVSELADHPAYGNAGEVPIGGRGKLGRTPVNGQVNMHVERPFKVSETTSLQVSADLFNITNSRPIVLYDQNSGISFSPSPNPDFQKVSSWETAGYQRPFNARFSLRWIF